MDLRYIMGILVLGLLVGCQSNPADFESTPDQFEQETPEQGAEETPEQGEEETGDELTGNVVATVNGEEITSEEVSAIQQTFMQQGQQVSEEQALEQVISQKLLAQEAQEHMPTNEEAESAIEMQLQQQNATLEQYKQQVQAQGMSYEEQLQRIREDLAIQTYLEANMDNFTVTDEEAEAYYDEYKASQAPNEVPPYEELEAQIVATVQQQKQQEARLAIVEELKEDAEINYN
ncbi:MAG: SurA N-terminal domain-containing protein [Candidatus Woesearchaeota archaeon]